MFVTETTLLELREGQAVVLTDNLYRIIELPSGRVVGELANLDDAVGEYSNFWDLPDSQSPYRVAVDYKLLTILEKRGIALTDVVVAPTSGTQCMHCGSEIRKRTKNTYVFECGTKGKRDRDRYSGGDHDVFWPVSSSVTDVCRRLDDELIKKMGPKSALLKRILIEAGETLVGPDDWWIIDGRDGADQFPGIEMNGPSPITPSVVTSPMPMPAAMLA